MFTQKPPNDCSQDLYDMYKATIADYNQQTLLPSLCNKHDEYLLRELVKSWSKHKLLVVWLSLLFRYLERCFITRRGLLSLNDVGLTCFHDLVYQNIKTKATDAVIAVIRKEREGEQIDRALLKNVVDVYVENGMDKYEEDFESFMLKDVASYYSRKVSRWIQEDSFPDYMRKSEECLRNEMERVHHYFHQTTEPKLVEVVQNELLVVVAKQLLDNEHSGFRAMLRDGKMDDLSRMYRLYNPIQQGLERVADVFKQHVTSEGNALIKQAHDAAATNQDASNQGKVLIRKVIELHDKYMEYVNECFENHTLFHKALKEAFEVFCNKSVAGSSIAELLATFCDYILKKEASENLSYEAIERTLDNVVELLAYISEKDLFAEFYRKKQAHRLLFNRSACYELERSMLTKLNELLGDQFSSRMEGMVNDMSLAKDSKNEFRKYLTNGKTEMRIDLNVKVLTTGFWPAYKTSDINLPSEMVKCIEVFKGFNEIKTKQRRLSWIYSLGTCQIVGNFDAKPIELTVSTYQAALLLLFNNTGRLSYEEILEQLNLSHEDLFRLLHSLSCAKYKILLKEPVSRNISKTDTFEFNSKFNDRSRRIKVLFPLMDEQNKVVEDVDKNRRYAIDAAIVRIMKSRKSLPSQELVSECVEHFSRMFTPDIKMIMKRIEDLISRDYLERDQENPHTLKYVAF